VLLVHAAGFQGTFKSDVRGVGAFGHLVPHPPRGTGVIAMTPAYKAEQITTPRSLPNRYVLHLHGGAYLFGFPALFRDFTWRIADAAGARVLCIDYRLAPEHPFPAAIEDATAAYRWLIAECAESRHVAFIGDSSGGGLALASMMRLRDEGSPLPAAAVVLSPWTDLALTGQSLTEHGFSDPMVPIELMPGGRLYLAGADPRSPTPPLCGDRQSPTLIMSAAMRHCAMMRREWPSACASWAARSNSKCGRACSMSGICSRASCQKRAQRSHASARSFKPGCHDHQ
jgi:acetyl esterase/lipase